MDLNDETIASLQPIEMCLTSVMIYGYKQTKLTLKNLFSQTVFRKSVSQSVSIVFALAIRIFLFICYVVEMLLRCF